MLNLEHSAQAGVADRLGTSVMSCFEDACPEADFDDIARDAADLFRTPHASVSFVDDREVIFAARRGLDMLRIPRNASFCAHTILGEGGLVVPDAQNDPRFRGSPLVLAPPFVRFYAGSPIMSRQGQRVGAVCIMDVVPRRRLTSREGRLLASLARMVADRLEASRLRALHHAALRMAEAVPDAVMCSDDTGRIAFCNPAAARMFGYSVSELIGLPLELLVAFDEMAERRKRMGRLRALGEHSPVRRAIPSEGRRRDGTRFPVEVSVAAWGRGKRVNVGMIVHDATERHGTREPVLSPTRFDALTGLANRAHFLERLQETLGAQARFSVLKVGLDGFRRVNGALGVSAGDAVLVETARRIRNVAGDRTVVARLGADEFGILVDGDEPATAGALAERVIDRMAEPFRIGATPCHVGASVGVACHPGWEPVRTADAVLRQALLALQRAKADGGRRVATFEPRLARQLESCRVLEEEVREAGSQKQFELFFQPQVEMRQGRTIGCEALLRWRHPVRGLLPPAAFLSVLEKSDAATAVGRWIVREACAFAAEVRRRGLDIKVGVNLFAAQIRDDGLVADVLAALAATGLPPRLLELEITETTVLGLDDDAVEPLRRLRQVGVGLAFDDYGTGYASLSLLKRYPLTRLKIDRDFVQDLGGPGCDAAIIEAIVALSGRLGIGLIAEGVETPTQAAALLALGCVEAQGHLYGRPMPAADLERQLAGGAGCAAA